MKDYSKLEEITVKSQEELDEIPSDFQGRIYIEFGTWYKKAIVSKRYPRSVVAWDNSNVVAWGNSNVEAWDNSNVVAWGNSNVVARDNSNVVAWGNSNVEAWDNSNVVARDNSNVEARDNSNVVARDNSNVVAFANVQVVDYLQGAKIKISGNARIVYNPKSIHEFMDFHGIKHTKTKAIFYKAVHKKDNQYFADYDNDFEYTVGRIAKVDDLDTNAENECGRGIHISTQNFALLFGQYWKDLAIIEVEAKIDEIILPKQSEGKVRTSKIKVLREVPLEECGLYGKILAKRRLRQ